MKIKLEKLIIAILIPLGIMYVFFMLPTQVPDETAHITRIIEISNGHLFGSKETKVPAYFMKYDWVRNYNELSEMLTDKTDYSVTVDVPNFANGNLPIAYIFPSITFFIARIFKMNGLIAIYLGRLLNLAFYIWVIYTAIKKIPFGKLIIATISFAPMILQQCASLSADSMIISLSILFVAYTMFFRFAKQEDVKRHDYIIYVLSAVFLMPLKYVYAPMVLMSLILLGNKDLDQKKRNRLILCVILIPILICLIWYMATIGNKFTSTSEMSEEFYIDDELISPNPPEQISFILHHPFKYIGIFFKIIAKTGATYIKGAAISPLGWLNIELNRLLTTGFLFLLFISPILENNSMSLNAKERILFVIICAIVIALIITVYYLAGANVGGDEIFGCQGRYFIPLLALPFLCISQKENYFKVNGINAILPLILLLINLGAILSVFLTFK